MNNKEYQKQYRESHREQTRERYRKWSLSNKELIKFRGKEFRRVHAKELSEKDKQLRIDLKIQVMDLLGGPRCVRCGFTDIRALQIDHIGGGGNQDLVARKHGKTYYYKILREGGVGLQVLCANCNWIKRYENHEL